MGVPGLGSRQGGAMESALRDMWLPGLRLSGMLRGIELSPPWCRLLQDCWPLLRGSRHVPVISAQIGPSPLIPFQPKTVLSITIR